MNAIEQQTGGQEQYLVGLTADLLPKEIPNAGKNAIIMALTSLSLVSNLFFFFFLFSFLF